MRPYHKHQSVIENIGVVVLLWICNLDVIGSNLGQEIRYPEGLRGFTRSLHPNCGTLPRSDQASFLPNLFLICYSLNYPIIRRWESGRLSR
jgi:hypothetical protein